MSDIATRLREFGTFANPGGVFEGLPFEAAAEIERLTAENEKMRGAFKVIDSVIPSAIPGNSDAYVKMICARFIDNQQQAVNSEEGK